MSSPATAAERLVKAKTSRSASEGSTSAGSGFLRSNNSGNRMKSLEVNVSPLINDIEWKPQLSPNGNKKKLFWKEEKCNIFCKFFLVSVSTRMRRNCVVLITAAALETLERTRLPCVPSVFPYLHVQGRSAQTSILYLSKSGFISETL